MLTLNDGRSELWQWDTGRTLTVDADCSQVHFSNKVFGRSIDVDVVGGAAIIPDILLQTDKDLSVWAFVGTAENGYTKISKTFKVNRRNKPADYVFTPPEQTTLAELVERLDRIEESQGPDAIKNAVEDYLEQNPVEIPVQSVNGQTGAVELTADDVGAISQDDLQNATNEALAQAKASGEFDGPQGPEGPQGPKGEQGIQGPAGPQGPAGNDGYTPVKGVDYFDGAKGDKGEKGDTGATGPAGANGKSAYAYAAEGGYTGTEAEFAAKLAQKILVVDATLTQSGQAADAKAVGDAINSLPEEIIAKQTVINVMEFGAVGDGATDDTAAIQSALDAAYADGFSAVRFPSGIYKVTADKADNNFYAALNVHSGQHLIFESATLKLSANGYDFYAVINIHNVENVALTGNLKIIGDRETHTGTTGESGHGIRIVNSKNVYVSDAFIQYTWGDGVCVGGNGTMDEISENVTLERIRTYKCSRNGLSIIEADGVVVRDCDFTYTDRTAPQYGIDVEPNLGTATNITIENVRMLNNGIGGFALYTAKATLPGVLTLRNIETDAKTIIYTSSAAGGTFDVRVEGWRHTQKSGETNPTLRLSGKGSLRIRQLYVVNKSANRVILPLDIENLRMDGVTVEDDPAVSTKGTLSISGSADTSIGKAVITAFLSRNPAEVTWYSGNQLTVDNLQDTVVNLNEHLTTGGSSESYKLLLCDKALVLGTALSAKARVFIPYTYGNVNPFRVVNTTATEVQLYTTVSAGITFVGDVPGGSSTNSAALTGNASYEVMPMLANGFVYVHRLDTRVPVKISEITNDSGYQTAAQVESTVTGKGYQTAAQVESTVTGKGYQTESQVNTLIANAIGTAIGGSY